MSVFPDNSYDPVAAAQNLIAIAHGRRGRQRRREVSISLDARHAALLAFAQSRDADCTRTPDGKFGSGNKCQEEGDGASPDPKDASSRKEFFGTYLDSKAPQTTVDSATGPIQVIERKDVTNEQYLDDIEAEGERRGLVTDFDTASQMQQYTPIHEDMGPYAAFVRSGCSLMSGNNCGTETNAEETIDYNGEDYGTWSDERFSDEVDKLTEEWLKEDWRSEEESGVWLNDEMKKTAREAWMDENREKYKDDAAERLEESRREARDAAIPLMRRDLERDLARTELDCCVQLYRGMILPSGELNRIIKDGAISHEGANSWTTSRDTAKGFGGHHVLLVVRNPSVGHVYKTDHSGEKEITRPPSKMRIVGIVKTKESFNLADADAGIDTHGTVLYLEEDPDYRREDDDE